MQAAYCHWIVTLSYVIAVVASYVALDMASRVFASLGTKVANNWMIGGAVAMAATVLDTNTVCSAAAETIDNKWRRPQWGSARSSSSRRRS